MKIEINEKKFLMIFSIIVILVWGIVVYDSMTTIPYVSKERFLNESHELNFNRITFVNSFSLNNTIYFKFCLDLGYDGIVAISFLDHNIVGCTTYDIEYNVTRVNWIIYSGK